MKLEHDERFINLEVKLAYLEKTTCELDDVVAAQDRRILELTRKLEVLERHLRAGDEERDLPHEKPPHY